MYPKKLMPILVLIILFVTQMACSLFSTSSQSTQEPKADIAVTEPSIQPSVDSTNTPETSAPEKSQIPFRFVPFNYQVNDLGNGWKEGTITLAIENPNDKPILLERVDIEHPTVVTKEGPTYESAIMRGSYFDSPPAIWFSHFIYLPPNFRFYISGNQSYTLTFKFATAATPEKITFPNFPELDFTIPEIGQSIKFPIAENKNISSITALSGKKLANDSAGVEATLTGRCGNEKYFGVDLGSSYDDYEIWMETDVINHDKFYEKSFPIRQKFMIFTLSGIAIYPEMDNEGNINYLFKNETIHKKYDADDYTVYPGITGQDYLFLFGLNELEVGGASSIWQQPETLQEHLPLLVFWDESNYTVFSTSDCGFVNPQQ